MADVKWVKNHIEIDPPKRTKKITGTKLGAILGVNKWSTPFQEWCEITKTYNKPFEDTIYTLAGKTIEPKQAKYMQDTYFLTDKILSPTEKYGADYFGKTYGDFFPDDKIFGGMWDYLLLDEKGNTQAVFEMKTSKRVEDWADGKIPEYYALQASLYAYLLNVDTVYMVCSFLSDSDYNCPDKFECNATNTVVRQFSVKERYPNFESLHNQAFSWFNDYVLTGISPEYNAIKDKEYLDALKKVSIAPDFKMQDMLTNIDSLQAELDEKKKVLAPIEKELKKQTELLKEILTKELAETDTTAVITSKKYKWTLSKSTSLKIDETALQADGLYEKYAKPSTTLRLTKKSI